jgi:hypothetical protein
MVNKGRLGNSQARQGRLATSPRVDFAAMNRPAVKKSIQARPVNQLRTKLNPAIGGTKRLPVRAPAKTATAPRFPLKKMVGFAKKVRSYAPSLAERVRDSKAGGIGGAFGALLGKK